uniref:C-type lectin domain-containing protein n=1 Tax=Acrobeloides nanus TaxID=290746 RepID=A0A914D1Z7_9BILA
MENYLVHNLTYDGYPCPSYSYQYFCEYWIGLHNPYRDGVWRWTDGSDYDFKAWQDGSPTSGLCAVLYHNRVQSIISWYDSACSGQERRILCEITPLKK